MPSLDTNTAPTLRAVAALAEEKLTMSSALSELIDNAFGEARGDARRVVIVNDSRRRLLTILDDGRGIERLADLFQLGSASHASHRDIGWYGYGGSKVLMALARPIEVYALRAGRTASTQVDWDRQIDRDEWPTVPTRWMRPTVQNCPTELLEQGHGTLIRLHLRPGIIMREDNIRRELAKTYGPGLRSDRTILWQNAQGESIALTDPIDTMAHTIAVGIEFTHNGVRLGAQGTVGYNATTSIAESRISIGFGFRRLFTTKKPFGTFHGKGVIGAIDLEPGWQPFFSTLKDGLNHAGVEQQLYDAIHQQILPLLRQLQQQDELMLFDELGDFLNDIVGQAARLKPDEEGDTMMAARTGTGEEGDGEDRDRPGMIPPFTRPMIRARVHRPRGVIITRATDADLEGLLCRVEPKGPKGIVAYVNAEHRWIADALAQTPPNRAALAFCVARQMAPLVLERFADALLKRATPGQVAHYHRLDPITQREEREDLAVRILVDRWMVTMAAS